MTADRDDRAAGRSLRAAIRDRDRNSSRLRTITAVAGLTSVLAAGGLTYSLANAAHATTTEHSSTSTSGSGASAGSASASSSSGSSGASKSAISGSSSGGLKKSATAPSSSSSSGQVTSGGS